VVLLSTLVTFPVVAQPDLETGFASPPAASRPHTWWHWMDGMVTREGITRDLEEMAWVGLGGAQLFDVALGMPSGPVRYMSDSWRELVTHAVHEANRVGLELCLHNCAGWSSSGGPWITPEYAMQVVTWSETTVQGPLAFRDRLPEPDSRLGFYDDIAVLAFPAPEGEGVDMRDLAPEVSGSAPAVAGDQVLDGDENTYASLPKASPAKPQWLLFTFPTPFTARSMALLPAPGNQGHRGEVQVSDNGVDFRTLSAFQIPSGGAVRVPLSLRFETTAAQYWRVYFTRADARAGRILVGEVSLTPAFRLQNWRAKAGFTRGDRPARDPVEAAPDNLVPLAGVLDLTTRMEPDGTLDWDVPEGNWTILRLGHTPTGKTNHPAPEEGRGLECDKLNAAAADLHWENSVGGVIADAGELVGTTLNNVLIDSYEVGCQNWTPALRKEFIRLRSYDPLPYLPAMTGRVVESTDVSERFLWDLRRTLADLFAENYFGRFAERAHAHGMLLSVEPYGDGNFDDLTAGMAADIPMSEFWVGGPNPGGGQMAASIANTFGRTYVGAEAFTTNSEEGGWRTHPYSLKALGDLMYCAGINRFIFHRYAHQPWLDLKPGMTMGPHGFHFERTNTWWRQAPAWVTYLSRCQFLLQQGVTAADLCYYYGEDAPCSLPARENLTPPPPAGLDYDGCNAEVLLHRLRVAESGNLVLPSGVRYRVLVLPDTRLMRPEILERVAELVYEGATVIGPRPEASPSLENAPGCDARVRRLAAELWGDCDGTRITVNRYGRGRVYWGRSLEQIAREHDIQPDFSCTGSQPGTRVEYIHRRTDLAEIYFVSNQSARFEHVRCRFRCTDRRPEIWAPQTGDTQDAPLARFLPTHTEVELLLEPRGSVFVVFRRPLTDHEPALTAVTLGGESVLTPRQEHKPALTIVEAAYGVIDGAALHGAVDVTDLLRRQVKNGRLRVRVDNSLAGDPAPQVPKELHIAAASGRWMGEIRVPENQWLELPPADTVQDGQEAELAIERAVYGDPALDLLRVRNEMVVDVTDPVRQQVVDGRLSVIASNALAGDPAPYVRKQMRVRYEVDGTAGEVVVGENEQIDLPPAALDARAPAAVRLTANGEPRLQAWTPGIYRVESGTGTIRDLDVPPLPAPIRLEGPWQVRFPEGWGAPETVTFPELVSWPEHADQGIRFFSGTATYTTTFTVPEQLLTADRILELDLGNVAVIAEVWVNDRSLGLLWSPPFRVETTPALRAGRNRLRVEVTNLWVNRLIGDEQYPDDRDWRGPTLAAWPEWLEAGSSRPPGPPYTWTTWRHHSPGAQLLESGLIGPVTLRTGREIPLE
jgi:hypothetical protein